MAVDIPVRRILWAVAAWLLVVATGSWLTWSVISDVGEERAPGIAVPDRSAVPSGSSPDVRPAEPPSTDGPVLPQPGGSPANPATPSIPSSAPTVPAVPAVPSAPTARSGGATSDGPPTRTLTWTGAAGVVTTRCTGDRIELVGASASADGYVVEVDDRGPDRVRVEFEGRGDETVPETRVEARCEAGRPSYDVRVED